LLYLGGELLLENGLGASGADITITLIDVYNTAHLRPDSTNRGISPLVSEWSIDVLARIVQLLGMIDPSEPNRQRIIYEAVE
jgi:Golgi to ER traffic protein 4